MKSVLISIKPKYCELIANGKKTVEVRKTKPKIDVPFKCYIYCTYGEGLIEFNDEMLPNHLIEYKVSKDKIWGNCCNGKVIGEFVCDTIHEFTKAFFDEQEPQDTEEIGFWLDQFELSYNELCSYVGTKDFYGWHISNLVIYDKPKELREFEPVCKYNMDCECVYWDECKHKAITTDWGYVANMCNKKITRPPQSWCYVEELGV